MSLVSTDWLNKNLNKVKIIDASWHLVKNRNGGKEYDKEHIEDVVKLLLAFVDVVGVVVEIRVHLVGSFLRVWPQPGSRTPFCTMSWCFE